MPHIYVRCPDPSEFEAGFARLRNDFDVPEEFPEQVLEQAAAAQARPMPGVRRDARDIEFVAIDPKGSTDLDQVYFAKRNGSGYEVFYGIADVAAFVEPGSALDNETHARGTTFYAPDRRAPLHPAVLSEGNASLLADVDRPAVLWTFRLDQAGAVTDTRVERATVRNREQLSYSEAQARIDSGDGSESLMLLREIGLLRQEQATGRGAVSLNLPGQELSGHDGQYNLTYDEVLPVEDWNARMSLMTGMVAAQMMVDAGVGIVRTLPPPNDKTIDVLRSYSRALEVPFDGSYGEWVTSLNSTDPKHIALMTQATMGLRGAGYQAFDGESPDRSQHAAVGANYTHVTAPLRRLVDRFTSETALAIAGGTRPPGWVLEAFEHLPKTMQKARSRESRYERALLDFAEALVLSSEVGKGFEAIVVGQDDRGTEIQLVEPAIMTAMEVTQATLGEKIAVRLTGTDIPARKVTFERA